MIGTLYKRLTEAALHIIDPYVAAESTPEQRVWPYLKAHLCTIRWLLVLSLCITTITASIEVWIISYIGKLIDTLSATAPDQIWHLHAVELSLVALFILLLRPIGQLLRYTVNDIGFQCNSATMIRWQAHRHMTSQSVGWFQNDLTGRIASRLVDIGNYGADTIFHALNAVAFGLVYVVGILILMANTDGRLAIPLILWLLLYATYMWKTIPRMVHAQQEFQAAKSALIGGVVDSFSNMDTIKLFSARSAIEASHRVDLENTRLALFRTRQIGVSMRAIIAILEGLIMIGFVGYSIFLWSIGAATLGLISAAMALTLRITAMADWILDAVWAIFLRVGSLREALKTVGQPIAIPEHPDAADLSITSGAVEFNDLHHHYGLKQGGLNGLSLNIAPGEKVGLVGHSGAGKSTLVNLMLRFYDLEHGTIKIDDQDISTIKQESLQQSIGMVSQHASLLHRSVRDNIALGQTDATDKDIMAAAKEAHAHDFIMSLCDNNSRTGYNAHVGERGVKLSGGQRQRIALARVILKNAPILILDEATSALDSEVEAQIQTTLIHVMQNKTVIAIAHRLSTIAQMDRIVVMDNGAIIEQGSHTELLGRDSRYARFWKLQSGGFIGVTNNATDNTDV